MCELLWSRAALRWWCCLCVVAGAAGSSVSDAEPPLDSERCFTTESSIFDDGTQALTITAWIASQWQRCTYEQASARVDALSCSVGVGAELTSSGSIHSSPERPPSYYTSLQQLCNTSPQAATMSLASAPSASIRRLAGGRLLLAATSGRSYATQATARLTQRQSVCRPLIAAAAHKPALLRTQPSRQMSIPSTTVDSSLERKIEQLLTEKLQPTHLEVEDTSGGCGAFFRLLVVSPEFKGLSIVKQHRYVNELLRDIVTNIHGLTLVTKTPEGYEKEVKAQVNNL